MPGEALAVAEAGVEKAAKGSADAAIVAAEVLAVGAPGSGGEGDAAPTCNGFRVNVRQLEGISNAVVQYGEALILESSEVYHYATMVMPSCYLHVH